MSEQNWLTAGDAAKILKCSPRQVHRYGETGQLVTRRAGRRVLFAADSVAQLADELQVDYRPPPTPSRDLQPVADLVEHLRRRDTQLEESYQRIDERLSRLEGRQESPRWIGRAIILLIILVGLVLIILIIIALRI
jgi:DNA-binding transcriptional MerR regulator